MTSVTEIEQTVGTPGAAGRNGRPSAPPAESLTGSRQTTAPNKGPVRDPVPAMNGGLVRHEGCLP